MHQSIETPTLWVPGKGRGFDIDTDQKASISLPPEARVQIKRPYPWGNKDENIKVSRDMYLNVACKNSCPSSLPAWVAFRVKDVCDLPPKIPYWWRTCELCNFAEIIICGFCRLKPHIFRYFITYTPCTKTLCPAANVLHSHICTSCASNFRRTEYRYFRNTGNWWDPLGGSKPDLRVNSHIWIMWYQND